MKCTVVAVLVLLTFAGGSVAAHHSYAKFLTDQTVSIEGDVQSIVFASPHVVLRIRTADAEVYTVTWSNTIRLTHEGVARDTLKVGDRLIVRGSPSREAGDRELSLVKSIERPRDGWRWGRPA